jgi:phosphatidylglycerophosphate synthase
MSETQPDFQHTPFSPFNEATRIHETFITRAEKKALLWLAERTPEKVNSDHLTALGALGMLFAGLSYVWSRYCHYGLLLSCVFLFVNWLGDSLDGTLARFRKRQRLRYGFYVDHVIDCFGVTALLGGMALSGYMHPLIAASLLVAYLLLSSEIFLATYSVGRFEMSYFHFGPTELRILLCLGNVYMFLFPNSHPLGNALTVWDLGGLVGAAGMLSIAIGSFIRHTRALYRAEPLKDAISNSP